MPDRFTLLSAGDPRLAGSVDLAVARLAIETAVEPDRDQQVQMLGFLATHPDALLRSCAEGHLTGSALVVSHDAARFLLLHHRKLRRWLQPGGHADGDANLAAVAWREATEETGIDGLRIAAPAIDLDVHVIDSPSDGRHLHLDVRFLVVAPPDAVVVGNHESTGLRWFTESELAEAEPDAGLERLVQTGLRLARTSFWALDPSR